jgi:hypothetical protein
MRHVQPRLVDDPGLQERDERLALGRLVVAAGEEDREQHEGDGARPLSPRHHKPSLLAAPSARPHQIAIKARATSVLDDVMKRMAAMIAVAGVACGGYGRRRWRHQLARTAGVPGCTGATELNAAMFKW